MTQFHGVSDLRRTATVATVLLLAMAIFAAVAAPSADARPAKPARVSLSIATQKQAQLLRSGRLVVRVRSTGRARVRVSAVSAGRRNFFRPATVSFRRRGTRTVRLWLTRGGRNRLGRCGTQAVRADGRYGRRTARASRRLGRDGSRCITVPLGADPANCDFLDTTVCLQPFANDYYTVNDPSTPTGKKLNIADDATPSNNRGGTNPRIHMDPTDINRSDGFSPGNMIVLKVPGLDTPAAFQNSNLVPITDLHAYDDPNQSVMVIDAATGERHPIWAEIDSNPTSVDPVGSGPGGIGENPSNTDPVNLIIRPAVNYDHGHRYIVVLRNLKDENNQTIPSPPAFRAYRDSVITNQGIVEQRRPHMNSVIAHRRSEGGRPALQHVHGLGLHRGQCRYDDRTRTDHPRRRLRAARRQQPRQPHASRALHRTGQITSSDPGTGTKLREVNGTIEVPCYLSSPNCNPGGTFEFDVNDELTWNPSSTTDVPFRCDIPTSVVDLDPGSVTPAQTGTYGHGLLGEKEQVRGQDRVGNDGNTIWCAVDWAGFADEDTGSVLAALGDMSNFPKLVDRMQQGFVNFMYLQRALVHPSGFATDPAFQFDPDGPGPKGMESLINTSLGVNTRGQYMGISQGGIMGGALTALSPDADYGVLGVPGPTTPLCCAAAWTRTTTSRTRASGSTGGTPKKTGPLLLSLVQIMWDRGEANGYAHFATDNPLPDTPPHTVLLRAAFGDHQVANVTAEVAARTYGASVYYPALQPGRHWDTDPFLGLPKVTDFPFQGGSMLVYYDGGPETFFGRSRQGAAQPPNGNVPPRKEWGFGDDPHGQPRASPRVSVTRSPSSTDRTSNWERPAE